MLDGGKLILCFAYETNSIYVSFSDTTKLKISNTEQWVKFVETNVKKLYAILIDGTSLQLLNAYH